MSPILRHPRKHDDNTVNISCKYDILCHVYNQTNYLKLWK